MNPENQPEEIPTAQLADELPEGWQQPAASPPPVHPRQRSNTFRNQVIAGALVTAVLAVMGYAWFKQKQVEARLPHEPKTAILPQVRWDYKTVVVEGRDVWRDSKTGKYATTEDFQNSRKTTRTFSSVEYQIDKDGESGWELVSAVPNIETTFPTVRDGQTQPFVRTAEIILIFKRPSAYQPTSDEMRRDMEEFSRNRKTSAPSVKSAEVSEP
jgi:hypothetical protein